MFFQKSRCKQNLTTYRFLVNCLSSPPQQTIVLGRKDLICPISDHSEHSKRTKMQERSLKSPFWVSSCIPVHVHNSSAEVNRCCNRSRDGKPCTRQQQKSMERTDVFQSVLCPTLYAVESFSIRS